MIYKNITFPLFIKLIIYKKNLKAIFDKRFFLMQFTIIRSGINELSIAIKLLKKRFIIPKNILILDKYS